MTHPMTPGISPGLSQNSRSKSHHHQLMTPRVTQPPSPVMPQGFTMPTPTYSPMRSPAGSAPGPSGHLPLEEAQA